MGLAKDRSRSSYASRPHVRSYAALFLVFAVIAMMVTIFENIDITGFAVNYQSLGVNQTMVQQGGSLRFTATGSSTLGHDVKLVCRLVSDNTLLCSSSRVESNPSCNVGIPADFQTGTHEVKCELREIDADGAITDRKEKRINVTVTSPGGGGGGQCATQPNGIVSWWRAEGNASDAKGINHGTLVGTTFATGKVGQTFSFDGNDYVRVSHSSSLEPQELTVMAWLYPQPPHAGGAGGFGGIVEKATEDRDSYALTAYDNGVIAFSINWEQGFERCDSAAGALPGNAWSYVAATFDTARSAKIYVNGALSKSCTFTSGIKPITGNLHIGLNPGGADEYFKGRIDELAIFNKALSSSDISAVFNAGPDGMCVAAPPPGGPVMSSLTPNPATVTQGSTVTFNSVGSSPGGNVKLVCGSTSRGTNICPESSSSFVASNPSCTYSVPAAQSPGNYSIYCRIKDTTGAESPERTTQITVQAAGGAPVLNSLGANPQTIAPGDSVTFTGSGTWTNNVKLICRQGANQVCQTASFVPASPSCSYTTPSEISAGNYTIFCKLRDTTGAESSERSTQVTVQSGGGAQCGNGVREGSEQCDDGNANSNDACTNSCRNNVCGDGFVATGAEQCDDGNLQGGDGCSSTCTTEQQPPALTSIGVPPQVRQGETLTITSVASSPAGQNIQLRCGKASGTSDLCPGGAYASQNPACSVTVAANYQLGTLPVFCKVYDDAGTPSGEKSATTEVVAGGPALTGLTANPPLVQIGRTITFQGTGQSPSRTVKLACGSSQGANDICTSASFASADPSCPFTVPSNYPKGDRVVYCRVLDSANAVSTDRTVTMTVTDPTICTPLPPPTCNPGETPEAIDTNNDGCHDSYRCIPPVTSACRTITADTALTGNMVADRSPCLILDASAGSIALDGASYTITGDGSGIAIETRGSGGVGIKNLLLSNFQEGIVSTAGAGDLIINNSEISAVGSTAGTAPRAAVRVESANSLSLTRTTISTSGTGKDGVFAKSASAVIVDSSITTAGIDSRGVLLNDILSFAILNSTIITQNDGSDGIKVVSQNIPPSQAGNISWNQITTSGDNAPGISLISTEAALNSNIITTGGADSHGIYSSSSTLTASSNEMSTVGDVSHGFYLVSQSLYSLLENIISTTGDGSHGLYSSSPLDNSIAVENSISTSAIDAIPLYIYNTDKSTFDLNELKNDKQSVPMLLRLSTANRFADTLLGVNLSASPLPAIFNSEQGSYNNLITRISAGSIQLSFEATDVIIALAAPPTSPQGYSHLGRALDIRANSLSSNALLKFHYSEQELGNLDENKMKIWRYANGVWTDSGFSAPGQNGVNAQANFAFANITSFSVFAPLIEGTISCPAVPQPQCASGSPVAIRDESGCIASYECVSCSSSSTRGDLNGDGKIDEKDVAAASSIAAGQSPAPQNSCCIDIATPTGGITTDDVIAISRISSGSYGSAGTCSAPENPVENAPKGWIGFKRNKERTSYNPVGGPIKNIVIWTKSVGSEIRSSPVVLNDRVYIGSANAIHALDARTGNITWSFQTGSPVHSTPAVSTNGIVFAGSSNNKIYALNASNGNKIWEYATGGAVESSPLLHGGIVYAGSNDSKIYALNASSGTKVWEYATGDKVVSSPAFYRGVIFIGSNDNRTYALNASTGTHIWNQTTGGRVRSTPALHKGIVYVGSDDSRIYAFITRDGRKLWEHDAGSPVSSPAILERNNGDMIATGSASKTHILNITGQEIVAIPTVVPSAHSPATADKIYATAGNKLYAIDPGVQGYVVWSLDVGNSASSPAISGTVLYTANLSGNVYAIGELPPSTTVACNSNSARGDLNGDGRVDSIDVELADSVEAGDVAKPSNLCCIDINVLGGDGNVTTNDVEVITKIATGITTGAGTCSLPETPVIIGGIICQSPGGWSACEQNADGSFSRTRTVYVGSSCSPTAEEEGCLPTSCTQQSSEWGTCTGGTQSRTVYSPNPATFRCEAQQQSRSCISAETALQAINELRQEIENAKARGADPEIISLAESLLSQAEEAYDSGDYGLAYQKAQDGLTLIRGATVPESAIDPLWLALLIILLIILILLIIGYILAGREEEPNKVLYYVFYPGYVLRKRKGREESGNRCSICGQPTVIKQKCSVCGRTTCALHTISAGGRTYCPDHKPATRAVSGGAAATKTQAAAPPSNIPRTRRKKMRFLLRRPKK